MPFESGPCPSPLTLRIWNEASGLDWQAFPLLADIHGITDIETLVSELAAMRDFQEQLDG